MITIEQAQKRIENETKVYSPTDKKRLVVPAYGFSGAVDAKRVDWLPPTYEAKEYNVKGFEFHNPKDDAKQVLKQEDGCFIMYDAPGLKQKVEDYIKKNPKTFESVEGLTKFVEFLKQHAIDPNTGKADVYDTDINFVAGLIGAPTKDKIKPGIVFVGAKKKETVKAIYVSAGEEFQGAEGHPQKADKGGAYIVSDTAGLRLVQADVFKQAYALVSGQKLTEYEKGLAEIALKILNNKNNTLEVVEKPRNDGIQRRVKSPDGQLLVGIGNGVVVLQGPVYIREETLIEQIEQQFNERIEQEKRNLEHKKQKEILDNLKQYI